MIKILTAALIVIPSYITTPVLSRNVEPIYSTDLKEVVIKAKKIKKVKKFTHSGSEFFGYKLMKGVNTQVTDNLKTVLSNYSGPKTMITSLKRNWNSKSQHNHGNAVDFNWDENVIDYLVSEEGKRFLKTNNLAMYIEDRPGSKKLVKYKNDEKYSKFVFENPHATGPHIHLNINR